MQTAAVDTPPVASGDAKFLFLATGAPAVGMANDENATVWWVSRPGDLDIYSGIPLRFWADDENRIVYVWPDDGAQHEVSAQVDFAPEDVMGEFNGLRVSTQP